MCGHVSDALQLYVLEPGTEQIEPRHTRETHIILLSKPAVFKIRGGKKNILNMYPEISNLCIQPTVLTKYIIKIL